MLITLDQHGSFSVLHLLQKDKQRKQRHSLCEAHYVKLGKKRRKSSKRNHYIPRRVIMKAIIINVGVHCKNNHSRRMTTRFVEALKNISMLREIANEE